MRACACVSLSVGVCVRVCVYVCARMCMCVRIIHFVYSGLLCVVIIRMLNVN